MTGEHVGIMTCYGLRCSLMATSTSTMPCIPATSAANRAGTASTKSGGNAIRHADPPAARNRDPIGRPAGGDGCPARRRPGTSLATRQLSRDIPVQHSTIRNHCRRHRAVGAARHRDGPCPPPNRRLPLLPLRLRPMARTGQAMAEGELRPDRTAGRRHVDKKPCHDSAKNSPAHRRADPHLQRIPIVPGETVHCFQGLGETRPAPMHLHAVVAASEQPALVFAVECLSKELSAATAMPRKLPLPASP